jgi:hypothetical protein
MPTQQMGPTKLGSQGGPVLSVELVRRDGLSQNQPLTNRSSVLPGRS